MRIWMPMAPGIGSLLTGWYGNPKMSLLIGCPIDLANGFGRSLGAGPGSMTLPGGSRLFTMAGGYSCARGGTGYRVHGRFRRCMRQRLWGGRRMMRTAALGGFR